MKPVTNLLGITALVLALGASAATWAEPLSTIQEAQAMPRADIQLKGVEGSNHALSDYKGKVLLVDFWASWCGPCRESFPWMNSMQQQYQTQGLEVVAINLDEEPELARAFLQQVPASFTVLLDTDAQLPAAFGLIGMPTSYLIDREGRIRARHVGFHASRVDDYENSIKTLLTE
ncbi:MAG: TlpA disulfide reductase family protein [Motiliproteus sp.]